MKEQFHNYFIDCFHVVPTWIYVVLFLLFCVGTVSILIIKGLNKGLLWSARLLLIEYLFLLLSLTVLFRPVLAERMYYLVSFQEGARRVVETIMNLVVLIPVGVLLAYAFEKMKWWDVLLFGCGFSILIEFLQFFFKRGFAELIDIFLNVSGCMLGYGIYVAITHIFKTISNKRIISG